jgi:uncharacterized membrane protein
MSQVEDFLTPEEEQEIVQAIVISEKNTSGEIRVHIENHTDKKPLERAQEVFYSLKMENTRNQNGVLFYVGVTDHSFVILGDKGINNLVEEDFWDKTKDLVISHFKQGNYKQGLVEGILKAGNKLKDF